MNAKAEGKIKGEGELSLALNSLTINGKTYTISTNTSQQVITGKGKRTGIVTGGGAGAGAGFATGTFTGNSQIELPTETPLTFTIQHSIALK